MSQRIDRTLNIILVVILFFSFFLINRNDKKYNCYAIGVNNESTCFYLTIEDEEKISIAKYEIKGNDYSKALEHAQNEGYKIDFNVLKAIYLSDDLKKENEEAVFEYYKNLVGLTTLVFKCNLDILLLDDVSNKIGIFIIPELYSTENGGTIFLDAIYKRKKPISITFSGDRFID